MSQTPCGTSLYDYRDLSEWLKDALASRDLPDTLMLSYLIELVSRMHRRPPISPQIQSVNTPNTRKPCN